MAVDRLIHTRYAIYDRPEGGSGPVPPPPPTTTLAKAGGTPLLEVGATITNPSFTSAPSSAPTSAIFTDNQGNPPLDVTATPLAWTYLHAYSKTVNAQTVGWTITDVINATAVQASVAQQWAVATYFGPSSSVGPFDEAFIEGLATKAIATTRNRSITYNLVAGQREVIALPTVLGAPTFMLGPFVLAPDILALGVSVTNIFGVVLAYDVYGISDFATGPSSATIVVS